MTGGGGPPRRTSTSQRLPRGGRWRVRGREIAIDHPIVVGILNVTPDSFSDGGRYADPAAALTHAEAMLADGADVLDVGGESTRPQNAQPISDAEERRRVLPVVRAIATRFPEVTISIDTVKSGVAEAALGEGAHIVNDVSGFRLDPGMAKICGAAGCGVVLMHSRGDVATMAKYDHAVYDDIVETVMTELAASLEAALAAGIPSENIVLDPGIGFAKRSEHSLAVLGAIPRFLELGREVLVGPSRKRFIGELTGVKQADARVHGSVGASVAALMLGARLFRVHDVAATRQALDVAWAVLNSARE